MADTKCNMRYAVRIQRESLSNGRIRQITDLKIAGKSRLLIGTLDGDCDCNRKVEIPVSLPEYENFAAVCHQDIREIPHYARDESILENDPEQFHHELMTGSQSSTSSKSEGTSVAIFAVSIVEEIVGIVLMVVIVIMGRNCAG
jgi:hypothetical protein